MKNIMIAMLMASLFSLSLSAQAKVTEGQPFPDFKLSTLDGKPFSRNSLDGKIVLVDFWAQWCEPCKISMPFLNNLAKKYKSKGVVVVGINVDDDISKAKSFLKEHPAPNIQILSDADNKFVKQVNVKTMPSSFMLDRKGVVRMVHQGFREDDKKHIESEIQKLLKVK